MKCSYCDKEIKEDDGFYIYEGEYIVMNVVRKKHIHIMYLEMIQKIVQKMELKSLEIKRKL